MPTRFEIAQGLRSLLGLDRPPVALAKVVEAPPGVPWFAGVSPSACSFWPLAETRVFAVHDRDHMNCPIGAMVAGFALTAEAEKDLGQAVAMMCDVGYLDAAEAAHVPSMPGKGIAMVYGPLSDFPVEPDVALLWLRPDQAMIVREAMGDAEWRTQPAAGLFGRPACAALAVAARTGKTSASLGCLGMRTFTGVDPSYLLAAIPGRALADAETRIRRIVRANDSMREHYQKKKANSSFAARFEPRP